MSEKCGCQFIPYFRAGGFYAGGKLKYCPTHAAAPLMLEALRKAAEYYEMLEEAIGIEHEVLRDIRVAIAAAGVEDENNR